MLIHGEVNLWKSVLLTAIKDSCVDLSSIASKYQYKEALDARNWLLNDNTNYYRVCSMAEVEPNTLRKKIQKIFLETEEINKIEHTKLIRGNQIKLNKKHNYNKYSNLV